MNGTRLFAAGSVLLLALATPPRAAEPIQILMMAGQTNHHWNRSTLWMQSTLEPAGHCVTPMPTDFPTIASVQLLH